MAAMEDTQHRAKLERLEEIGTELRFGENDYDLMEASLHWVAYLVLAKLEPVTYVLRSTWP